uniref:Uncharacterized protein n=1 Tax=Nelumbo nucifera TaxID=4432 RepID=A0A822YTA7_NELNU|nr:TPA_asm: hypothetical protein HUJ06_011309 [Nelumbo nucifera]
MVSLSTLKSMLGDDWYVNGNGNPSHHDFQSVQNYPELKDIASPSNPTAAESLLLQPVDSSSSCSESSMFNLDPPQV